MELDGPCEVEVLGSTARTFTVCGHHYALVVLEGLGPGEGHPYRVELDGADTATVRPGGPEDEIRTLPATGELRIAFGSCRVAGAPPAPDAGRARPGDPDALVALARRLRADPGASRPHLLALLGDQIYADHVSPETEAFIRSRREVAGEHGLELADFEEYAHQYREAWSEPEVQWLLANVPTAMIFDDHDVHDDWNTSAAWRAAVTAEPWWEERIVGAFTSYWVYQHLGNLSPTQLERDELLAAVRAADDAGELLREFALRLDRDPSSARWSYSRDLGRSRLVVVDTRAARVLDPARREMLDEAEWRWLDGRLTGDVDHLVIASSLPVLLAPATHHLEAWNEAVAGGAWGRAAAAVAERVRQALDLEHWAAFGRSFERLLALVADVGRGARGEPPASIVFASGDVHHAYLAECAFPRRQGVRSAVHQATCSPLRNPLGPRERFVVRLSFKAGFEALARLLARAARVPDPSVRWRVTAGPWFENQIATLTLEGRAARLAIETVAPRGADRSRLRTVLDRALGDPGSPAPEPGAKLP